MIKITGMLCAAASLILAGGTVVHADDPSSQDKQFMKDAASGGMAEVRLGQYASDNAESAAVKKFGEQMVDDHSKTNDKLKEVASQKQIEIPKKLSEEDQTTLDRLEALKGVEFDKAYVHAMVEDHVKDVAVFEKEINAGMEPEVKAFAAKALPTLKHHLDMARDLEKQK